MGPGDYTLNAQGLLVMTEAYLRRRGYCCRNGCLHCPYGYGPEGARRDRASGGKHPAGEGAS